MPMPLWWGKVNTRVFNPRELRNGNRQVIHHVGRSSRRSYRTPLEAQSVDDGFIFTLVYGSRSDWVRNVMAAGTAKLEVDGDIVDLLEPQLIGPEEAFAQLPADTKRPPGFLKISEFLMMRRTDDSEGSSTS